MPSTISVYDDLKPRPHHHTESHLNVDPAFIPRRVDANAFINGAKLLHTSLRQSYTPYDPSSAEIPDPNYLDTSHVHLLPTPRLNGLVESAIEAHSGRRHLIVSPDEVLGAIVGQFSYLMKKDELLKLKVWQTPGFTYAKPKVYVWAGMTECGTALRDLRAQLESTIVANLRDQGFASWFESSFTTTTETHQLMNAVLFLGQCPEFEPGLVPPGNNAEMDRGIVTVTMTGQLQDWIHLREMVQFLGNYDGVLKNWHQMLDVVLRFFIFCYAKPSSSGSKHFWRIAILRDGGRSAQPQISGWITAFCLWQWTGEPTKESFGSTLSLKGVRFKRIEIHELPPAFAILNLEVGHRGQQDCEGIDPSPARLTAGVFGSRYLSNGEVGYHRHWNQPVVLSELTAVQPFSAWFLFKMTPERSQQHDGMPSSN
ncbi:hypothetical protein KEM56_006857 [Ascosphaera pollenicola]|nr:hypothetical protein KEM56_006857 [Ascosphaera pollenicola]